MHIQYRSNIQRIPVSFVSDLFISLTFVGDGLRYAAKILSKHTNTWTVPMVLHDHDVGGSVQELNTKKQLLREDILRSFDFPQETVPSDTIRALFFFICVYVLFSVVDLSDDLPSCLHELDNLHAYLASCAQPPPPSSLTLPSPQQPQAGAATPAVAAAAAGVDLREVLPALARIMHVVQQGISAGSDSLEDLIKPLGVLRTLPHWLCIPGHA